VPGSGYSDADAVLEAEADIIGHINDGQMALPLSQIRCLPRGARAGSRSFITAMNWLD
jgi:enamidase